MILTVGEISKVAIEDAKVCVVAIVPPPADVSGFVSFADKSAPKPCIPMRPDKVNRGERS